MEPSTLLGRIGGDAFLTHYWQQHPLRARGPWSQPPLLLTAEELAGLATDPAIGSRIVMGEAGSNDWMIVDGPVTETFFSDTPDTDWSLTVYELDRQLPALTCVREPFRFLPDWRYDALSVGYAAPGGTLSQEPDDGDLFVIQVSGHTDWELSDAVDDGPHGETTTHCQLEPGDLLYMPPGTRHCAVATDDSVVYWVRFRAPTVGEMVVAWASDMAPTINEPGLIQTPSANPAAVPEPTRQQLRQRLRSLLTPSDEALDEWLGRYLTTSTPAMDPIRSQRSATASGIRDTLQSNHEAVLNPAVRLLVLTAAEGLPRLFVEGREEPFPPKAVALIEALGAHRRISWGDLAAGGAELEAQLEFIVSSLRRGWIVFDDELTS